MDGGVGNSFTDVCPCSCLNAGSRLKSDGDRNSPKDASTRSKASADASPLPPLSSPPRSFDSSPDTHPHPHSDASLKQTPQTDVDRDFQSHPGVSSVDSFEVAAISVKVLAARALSAPDDQEAHFIQAKARTQSTTCVQAHAHTRKCTHSHHSMCTRTHNEHRHKFALS